VNVVQKGVKINLKDVMFLKNSKELEKNRAKKMAKKKTARA